MSPDKPPLAMHRDLAWALKQQSKRVGEETPSVRGGDWRLATVTTVNGDGTVAVDGIPACRCMESYLNPTVGDVVRIDQSSSGNWLVMGRLAISGTSGWATYTPAWTASSTNPSLGNGSLTGRYQRFGRGRVVGINLIPGSTTSFGAGNYSFSLPATGAASGMALIGHAQFLASGSGSTGNRFAGQCVISSGATTTSPFFPPSETNVAIDFMSPTQPELFRSGDQLRLTLVYETAS